MDYQEIVDSYAKKNAQISIKISAQIESEISTN